MAAVITAALMIPSFTGFAAKKQKPASYDDFYNGTFEEGVVGKDVKGWTLQAVNIAGEYDKKQTWNDNYKLTVSSESAKGSKSMKIAPKNGTRGYVVADSELVSVSGTTGYHLGWYMKLAGIEEKANFYGGKVFVAQYDKNEKLLTRSQVNAEPRENMDWKSYSIYLYTEKDTAYIRIGFYMGGVWNKNPKAALYVDNVAAEEIPDDTLADGGFERGSSLDSVYSWHVSSKSIQNEEVTHGWAKNYTIVRKKDGYHGKCLSVTRNGVGYVSIDSNMMKAEGGTNYMLDYALRIENGVYETFYGVRAYIAEYDADMNLIQNSRLHAEIRDNTDWKELSYSLVTAENTRYIQVQFWCGGVNDSNFTAYFDDVSLRKVVRELSDDGIHNGGFEERVDGTILDWTMDARAKDARWEPTFEGYNDTKGLKCTKEVGDYTYEILKSNRFKVQAGEDYKLTYMVRLENQAENVYQFAQVVCYDAKGTVVERLRCKGFDHRTSSTEWLQDVGYYTIPEDTVEAQVEFLVCGTGFECWMDDFIWSLRDSSASIWGFDTLDKDGNISGWTVSHPIAAKADKKVWRNGTQSLYISQTTADSETKIISDELIPLTKETRYKFNVYVKSFDSDVERDDGIRLNVMCYSAEGNYLKSITGMRESLSADSEVSEWKELVLGVSTGLDVAYVRPYIAVATGTMNFWVDGLKWNIYDGNEFSEDFTSVTSDGKPDGWNAVIRKGSPEFIAESGKVTIQADDGEEGQIIGRWKSAREYITFDVETSYSATGGDAGLTITYYDYSGREIEGETVETLLPDTDGQTEKYSFRITAPSAAYAEISFGNTKAGTVSISSIQITDSEEETADEEGTVTDWRGNWIWHYEDYTNVKYTTRYFRYHFTLPDDPVAGTLQITADDEVKLWVNGTEITLDGANDWETVALVDTITDYLVAGENIFAIEVYNGTSAAALLFDGFAEMEDGSRVDFYSMDSVISNTDGPEGWQQPEYNDSAWIQCRIIGPMGTKPWSNLDFDASFYVSDIIELKEYTVTDKADAGDTGVLTMTVVPERDFKKDMDLTASLWIRNTTNKMVTLSLKQSSGPAVSEWKEGKEITVTYTFKIPEYLSTGKYILQLNINQIRISNDDVLNNKLMQAIRVTNDVTEPTITSEFKDSNGTMALYINGEPMPNMTYVTPQYQSFANQEADDYFHDAGICINRVNASLGGEGAPDIWTGPGEYDFSEIDVYMYNALERHEDSYLMVQLRMNVPEWWKEANPDELIVNSKDGRTENVSFASEKFLEDSLAANKVLLEHMLAQPYGQRIVGVLLAACSTDEWVWYGTGQYAMDYSPAAVNRFRKFLTEKYGTDAELRKAWNDNSVTLATAEVPAVEERVGIEYDTLLDPQTQRSTIDFHEFMAAVNVNMLKAFAKQTKEVVKDRLVVGAYYGYMDNTYYYGASNGTMHLGIGEALDDENLDFFAAPVLYNERYDGEAASYMTMIDSILAHGKAFMCENDNRLCSYVDYTSNYFTRESVGPVYDVWDSLSQIERDFSNQLTKGTGQWWFNMWGNFFSNKQFSGVINNMYREQKVNNSRKTDYQSDICYIIDEDMYTYLAYTDFDSNYDMLYWLLYQQRQELARTGTTHDMYYMSDLVKGLVPEYKIYMMLSPVEVDEEEQQAIEKYLKKNGSTIIWQYAAGFSDGNTISGKHIEELTGFKVSVESETRSLLGVMADTKNSLLDGICGEYYGVTTGKSVVSPAIVIQDKNAETLGYYEGTKDVSFAVKEMDGWTSVYTTIPCLPAEFFRNLLQENGCHVYTDNKNAVVYASDNYVAVNSAYAGDTEIQLDGAYSVYDVYRHKSYSLDTDTIVADMEDDSTRLYRLMKKGTHGVYAEAGEGGSSSVEGFKEYRDGDDVKITFKASKGYELAAIVIDGEESTVSGSKYTVKMEELDNSHFVEARFQRLIVDGEAVSTDTSVIPWFLWGLLIVTVLFAIAVIIYVTYKNKRKKVEK